MFEEVVPSRFKVSSHVVRSRRLSKTAIPFTVRLIRLRSAPRETVVSPNNRLNNCVIVSSKISFEEEIFRVVDWFNTLNASYIIRNK